jgi:hypothetical protein
MRSNKPDGSQPPSKPYSLHEIEITFIRVGLFIVGIVLFTEFVAKKIWPVISFLFD